MAGARAYALLGKPQPAEPCSHHEEEDVRVGARDPAPSGNPIKKIKKLIPTNKRYLICPIPKKITKITLASLNATCPEIPY